MTHQIDIIIPYYNTSRAVFERCLHSIYQQTMIHEIYITVVDDASTNPQCDYSVALFSALRDNIRILRLEENSGPGVARQYGLDHTSAPYVCFVDSDDVLSETHSIEYLYSDFINNEKCVISVSSFDEIIINQENKLVHYMHQYDNTWPWVLGKMYKRSFFEAHNICFPIWSWSNEDCGLNNLCKIYCNEEEQFTYNTNCTYIWMNNYNSITKANNFEYTFGIDKKSSMYGTLTNCTDIINKAYNDIGVNDAMLQCVINFIVDHYFTYNLICSERPENKEGAIKLISNFYKETYSKLEPFIPQERLEGNYLAALRGKVQIGQLTYVPEVSFKEYMDMLRR